MDLNIVVLCGRVASAPEIRRFESGSRMLRLLVTVRTDHPRRRVDVVPVTWWDPPQAIEGSPFETGTRVWIAGSAQRRFWDGPQGRRSRLEIIATAVNVLSVDTAVDPV